MKNGKDSKTSRIFIIDCMRSVSIFLVLAAHLGDARFTLGVDTPLTLPEFPRYWYLLMRNGIYGVYIFFLLSGFLITRTLLEGEKKPASVSLPDFYSKRIARIIPLLFLTILAGSLWLAVPSAASPLYRYVFRRSTPTLGLWASLATFSFNWYRIWHERILGPFGLHWDILWSLSIEEQFYLIYPLFLKKAKSDRNAIQGLCVMVLLGPLSRWLCYRLWPDNRLLGLTNSFAAFDLIAMGCLLYFLNRLFHKIFESRPLAVWACFIGGFGLASGIYVFRNIFAAQQGAWIYSLSLLDIGVFLILFGGLNFRPPQGLSAAPFRWLGLPGKLSYGMYLWHALVLYLSYGMLIRFSPWASYVVYAGLTILIGHISYRYFEIPMNHLLRAQFIKHSHANAL